SSGGAASAGLCAGYPSTYCSTTNLPTLGSIIQMTWGSHDSSTQCYGGYCPTDGINHIGIQDAAIVADPTGHSIFPVKISSLEWDMNPNPNPLVNQFAAAAPHDIFFDEDYFTSDADDDGFGVNFIASEIAVGCVRCAFDHNYFDGVKRDGGEGHVLSTQPPGPTTGWKGTPLVCGAAGVALRLITTRAGIRRRRRTRNGPATGLPTIRAGIQVRLVFRPIRHRLRVGRVRRVRWS